MSQNNNAYHTRPHTNKILRQFNKKKKLEDMGFSLMNERFE
jgi:hypothetical protein